LPISGFFPRGQRGHLNRLPVEARQIPAHHPLVASSSSPIYDFAMRWAWHHHARHGCALLPPLQCRVSLGPLPPSPAPLPSFPPQSGLHPILSPPSCPHVGHSTTVPNWRRSVPPKKKSNSGSQTIVNQRSLLRVVLHPLSR
jgi:hypothetical protein